jgi:hypothetical protein
LSIIDVIILHFCKTVPPIADDAVPTIEEEGEESGQDIPAANDKDIVLAITGESGFSGGPVSQLTKGTFFAHRSSRLERVCK